MYDIFVELRTFINLCLHLVPIWHVKICRVKYMHDLTDGSLKLLIISETRATYVR